MLDLFWGDQYINIYAISLIRSEPKVKRILLVVRCTSTTEYPPPKFILTGRSTARTTSSGLPQSRRLCGKEETQRRERVSGWIRKRVIQSLRRRCESVPTGKKTPWRSEKITGQEGVWRVADKNFYEWWWKWFVLRPTNISTFLSKRKAAETAATVRRRAAFRKTQTPSANSLTERHTERKKNLSLIQILDECSSRIIVCCAHWQRIKAALSCLIRTSRTSCCQTVPPFDKF